MFNFIHIQNVSSIIFSSKFKCKIIQNYYFLELIIFFSPGCFDHFALRKMQSESADSRTQHRMQSEKADTRTQQRIQSESSGTTVNGGTTTACLKTLILTLHGMIVVP
jgi:hypothetical protein